MLKFKPISENLAVAEFNGALINRIYDGVGYSFSYAGDAAVEAVRAYARKEEIPLRFVGVPAAELGGLLARFRHADIDAEDPERSSYRVSPRSEAELLDGVPEAECGDVTLSALDERDIADYARLCRDRGTNKYWGYDYSEDNESPDDRYFFESALGELARGTAISLAVRRSGVFIGEAVLYSFDLEGGADIALRLLPEWRGMGFGSLALEGLLSVAESIGLTCLRARVLKDNGASLALFSAFMDKSGEDGESVSFVLSAS